MVKLYKDWLLDKKLGSILQDWLMNKELKALDLLSPSQSWLESVLKLVECLAKVIKYENIKIYVWFN
jgi:hypothetical protein